MTLFPGLSLTSLVSYLTSGSGGGQPPEEPTNVGSRAFRSAITGPIGTFYSDHVLVDPYAPAYTQPVQTYYNMVSRQVELTDATKERISYSTAAAGTTAVTLANTGSITANKNSLLQAIADAVAANGTSAIHTKRRIRLTPGAAGWGTDYLLDVNLVDHNGVFCHLIIESTAVQTGALRPEGQRVGLDDVALMPFFGLTTYNLPAFMFAKTARRVWFVGIHFGIDPAVLSTLRASDFGRTRYTYDNNAGYTFQPGFDSTPFTYNGHLAFNHDYYDASVGTPFNAVNRRRETDTPFDIGVHRCVMLADDDVRCRRLILANFDRFVLRDSFLEIAADAGFNPDSQAVTCIAVHGDHIVINNHIYSAHGENIAYAGGLTHAPEYANTDLVFIGNDLGFADRWGPVTAQNPNGRNFTHKNMWECKVAQRVLIQANRIHNYYGYGRFGNQFHALVIKTSDQTLGEEWVKTNDVTIRFNIFSRVSGTFSIVGGDYFTGTPGWTPGAAPFRATNRLEFSHNITLPWDQTELGIGFSRMSGFFGQRSGTHNGDNERFLITDVVMKNNTLWGCDKPDPPPPAEPAYNQFVQFYNDIDPQLEMKRYTVNNNIFVGPYPMPNWPLQFITTSGSGSMSTTWPRVVPTSVSIAHNVLCGITNQAAELNATIGPTNKGFPTASQLLLDSTTLVPQAGSPAIAASLEGMNAGVDHSVLAAATARVITGRG